MPTNATTIINLVFLLAASFLKCSALFLTLKAMFFKSPALCSSSPSSFWLLIIL